MSNYDVFRSPAGTGERPVSLQLTLSKSQGAIVIYARTLRHAADQAALRARIGQMPDGAWWRALGDGRNGEALAALGEHPGLARWRGLPANPGPAAVERHLNGALRQLARETAERLPPAWSAAAELLRMLPDVLWLDAVLGGLDVAASLDRDSSLHALLALEADRRAGAIGTLAAGRFAGGDEGSFDAWWRALRRAAPVSVGVEGQAVRRLGALVDDYLRDRRRLSDAILAGEIDPDVERRLADGDCPLRAGYVDRLRMCLAGDPFHGVLPLVYLLLELDQMARLRSALLSCVGGLTE